MTYISCLVKEQNEDAMRKGLGTIENKLGNLIVRPLMINYISFESSLDTNHTDLLFLEAGVLSETKEPDLIKRLIGQRIPIPTIVIYTETTPEMMHKYYSMGAASVMIFDEPPNDYEEQVVLALFKAKYRDNQTVKLDWKTFSAVRR
jgi:hypothetical protein